MSDWYYDLRETNEEIARKKEKTDEEIERLIEQMERERPRKTLICPYCGKRVKWNPEYHIIDVKCGVCGMKVKYEDLEEPIDLDKVNKSISEKK